MIRWISWRVLAIDKNFTSHVQWLLRDLHLQAVYPCLRHCVLSFTQSDPNRRGSMLCQALRNLVPLRGDAAPGIHSFYIGEG
jgi:hypothetical protein